MLALLLSATLLLAQPASQPTEPRMPPLKPVLDALHRTGLAAHKDRILQGLSPAVHLEFEFADDESRIPIGASKRGGYPDLPPGFEWPAHQGRPLTFLLQLRLDHLPHHLIPDWPLPTEGLLTFWYDAYEQPWGIEPDDAGAFVVSYFKDTTALARTPHEHGHASMEHAEDNQPWLFKPFAVKPSAGWTADVFSAIPDAPVEDNRPYELADAINRGDSHHLLGVAYDGETLQDVQQTCHENAPATRPREDQPTPETATDPSDWRILLELSSDSTAFKDEYLRRDPTASPDWMWSDVGALFFMIRKQDLEAKDFTNIWGVLISG